MNTAAAISHDAAMQLAVEQADLVKGKTYPNPPVGAVILDRDGRVVGVGGTQRTGSAHAEVMALRRAGRLAVGGTAVVTLEPCNHHGKTPPCVDALIDAGVASVIYAVGDPNPVAAGGAARLAAAGINVIGDVQTDLVTALHRLAPADGPWVHIAEGPDDMPGHIKAMLAGVSLHVPVRGGALALGTWQGIYLVEHRARPHRREVMLQFIGSKA